tara:strand:- start:137 stop:1354 length:1218 start_codon:yes stop_codon:yes gene_type:complete
MEREAEHVEGFSPECAVVTHGGGKELEEPLMIRPTSETVIGHMYSQWIQSYRDLPILINQWCNVMRWEMRTRLFLRTSEFLWQEGHTAHENFEEAQDETLKMLEVYRVFQEEYLAIPVVTGIKSESEKFPGAMATYSIEAMMQDGKALQSGTSHNLGQNFAKAFDINYLDRNNNKKYVWTTSWGVSTRMIGGLIMTHSDDDGLIIPPKIAAIQVVIVPIFNNGEERSQTSKLAENVFNRLKGKIDHLQIKIDERENIRPAEKFFYWIQQGVPVRIEIGPRDLKSKSVMVARRDIREKNSVSIDNITEHVVDLLDKIQGNLFNRASEYRSAKTFTAKNYEEFKEFISKEGGFIYAYWNGSKEVEEKIKKETKATIRCIPFGEDSERGNCIVSGEPSSQKALFAISY